MNSNEVFDEVTGVIRQTFNTNDLSIDRSTSAIDVDGWDSLSNTMLMLSLEEKFGVKLPLRQIYKLKNVGDLADLIYNCITEKQQG